MPVKKIGNRWYVYSYITGKRLKRSYASKRAAENHAKTNQRRSKRKRSTSAAKKRKVWRY